MTVDLVMGLAHDAARLSLYLAGPILLAGLVAGVVVSVLQAVIQVQELTLTFIPKMLAIMAVLALLGHWMLGQLVGFTTTLLMNLPTYAR
jgi:flagellar biosynthetic protein FliQ